MDFFFPSDFPNLYSWFGVAQIYGPPWGGSPTLGFQVSDDRLVLHSAQSSETKTIHSNLWYGPNLSRGNRWEKVILRVFMSTDENKGFVELWYNGTKQKLFNGQERYYLKTLDLGRNWDGKTANILYAQQYRSKDMKLGEVSVYHDNYKVGTTFSSVN